MFRKGNRFFLYVYKFRSVKVIELIFTTSSKCIVILFRLNRNWLKGRDTNGKTVQLVDMKYVCIVTWQEERRGLVWYNFPFFFSISALRHCEHFPELFFIVSADKFYFQDNNFWWIWSFTCMTAIHRFSDYFEPEALPYVFVNFFVSDS